MRTLYLDFQSAARPRGVGYVLLLAGLGIGLFVLAQYQAVSQETQSYRELTRKLQQSAPAAVPAKPVDPKEAKAQEERMLAAKAVIDQLAVPWGKLFATLESIEDKEVAILQLSPDLEKRQIRLLVEAKNLAAMLRYHKLLGNSGALTDVALVDHEIQEQDPDRPVRFNITAHWAMAANARQ